MVANPIYQDQPVLLCDVPWSTYQGIVDALPEQRFRHAYDRGRLEVNVPVVRHVSWESYEAILRAFGDQRFRHTYAEGELEFMSPSEHHEWVKEFIGHLITLAAFELDRPMKSVGSTTRRNQEMASGLEPDLSYFVQNESVVRGRSTDEANPLPPDLAVEVEVTHRVLNRLETYATLQVAEVWRFRDNEIQFFKLEGTAYVECESSLAFPEITPADIMLCLDRLDRDDENSIMRDFLKTIRGRKSDGNGPTKNQTELEP